MHHYPKRILLSLQPSHTVSLLTEIRTKHPTLPHIIARNTTHAHILYLCTHTTDLITPPPTTKNCRHLYHRLLLVTDHLYYINCDTSRSTPQIMAMAVQLWISDLRCDWSIERSCDYHNACPAILKTCTVGPWLTNSIRSRGLVVTQVGRNSRLFFP
jgi:hypothetical protein